MGHAAVDDVGAGHAALYSLERALNLGQHATVNDALLNQLLDLVGIKPGQNIALRVQSPATLVKSISFSACSTSANLPATRSALIL